MPRFPIIAGLEFSGGEDDGDEDDNGGGDAVSGGKRKKIKIRKVLLSGFEWLVEFY